MGAPRFVQPRAPGSASGSATLALWLGIFSCTACVLSLGLLALATLPAGVAALVLGLRARRRGGGSAAAVLGAIGIALSLLALVFWVALVLIGGLTVELFDVWDDLERWFELPPVDNPADPAPPVI